MRTVWKIPVPVRDEPYDVALPRAAKFLKVDTQNGDPERVMLWVEVETYEDPERRTLVVYGTGHTIDPGDTYIGTAIVAGGLLVWHLYERPRA